MPLPTRSVRLVFVFATIATFLDHTKGVRLISSPNLAFIPRVLSGSNDRADTSSRKYIASQVLSLRAGTSSDDDFEEDDADEEYDEEDDA